MSYVTHERFYTMTDFIYKLDETDQITKYGRTLSRLYMENPTEPYKKFFAEDYDEQANLLKGGYVESTDILIKSDKLDPLQWPAWVANGSTASGDCRIPVNTQIEGSDLLNVKIIPKRPATVLNSVVRDSVLYNDCMNSTIVNSTCSYVKDSTIRNSTVTGLLTVNSTITDSVITSKRQNYMKNANITRANYRGGLSGTFSDITNENLTRHHIYTNIDRGSSKLEGTQFDLLEDENGHLAIFGDAENVKTYEIYYDFGDTTKEDVLELLNRPMLDKTLGNLKSIRLVESLLDTVVLTADDLAGLTTDTTITR